MLSISSYDRESVQACRDRLGNQIDAFREVQDAFGATDETVAALERHTFLNMILAMDALFGHRARAQELKDGNVLNEVRMICGSILKGSDTLLADKTIKYDPANSVLGLRIGEPLKATVGDFEWLSNLFLDEILVKYPQAGSADASA